MKRTVRIITTVAAIALTIAIMCVGIFAAKKVTVASNSSTITFTASDDVSATVTATTALSSAGTTNELAVPNGGIFTPSFNQGVDYSGEVTLPDVTFSSKDETFTLTIAVTNTFETAGANVNAKYSVTCANTNNYLLIETKANDGTADVTPTDSVYTVEQGKTVTFTTVIKVNYIEGEGGNADKILQGFTETFGFSLELTKATAAA